MFAVLSKVCCSCPGLKLYTSIPHPFPSVFFFQYFLLTAVAESVLLAAAAAPRYIYILHATGDALRVVRHVSLFQDFLKVFVSPLSPLSPSSPFLSTNFPLTLFILSFFFLRGKGKLGGQHGAWGICRRLGRRVLRKLSRNGQAERWYRGFLQVNLVPNLKKQEKPNIFS